MRLVLGSSGLLASQIANGAPYDVYLSADVGFVLSLEKSGHLLPETVKSYATGRLAIFAKRTPPPALGDLPNEPGRIAIANPAHAPYGRAARQALQKAGLWDKLEDRIVLGENVRQTLQFAESGNVIAAIVSWSLVRDRGGVLIPDSLHDPIQQAGGVVSSSTNRAAAEQFLTLLTSDQGKALLAKYGFSPPAGEAAGGSAR